MKTKPSSNKFLIVVIGPTAVGKTDLCIELAEHFKTEIISADSRQCYQGMQIGTAQPTLEQRQRIVHHFIDCLPIETYYSAGKFEKDAAELINTLFNKHQYVILTGGSGLYIQAVCKGLDTMPDVPLELRNYLNQRLANEGVASLREELALKDPVYYKMVDIHNPQRIIRALEICMTTGRTYSEYRLEMKQNYSRPFKIIKIGLDIDRPLLYKRINDRVDQMIRQGLLEEAIKLYPYKDRNPLQTVGYQELFGYIDKQYTLDEAIRLIKRNTRRYAKRQLTWFRKDPDIYWFQPHNFNNILNYIQYILADA